MQNSCHGSRSVFRAVLCAAGALFLTGAFGVQRLEAQATATITGTVTDSTGGAIADAAVQIKNAGTGIVQNAVTDAVGRYTVPQLAIGDYDVQASKEGFNTVVRRVTLTVGATPVVDFQLAVGQTRQTVTIEANVSQVETQSTAVASLVETKQIEDLPLNGRNYTQLLVLAPGVTQIPLGAPGAGSTFYGNGQKYTIAGSRPSGQPYLLDGQDMVNFWNNGPGAGGLGTALGVEAIAEFQTLTNTYSPQFGGNGAVINASSKSGTNGFHGSAYEYLRNNKLESRNFFDNTILPGNTAAQPPVFRRNQFGGSIGGPIKKNKLFFFGNYEGLRQKQVISNVVTVPEACIHNIVAGTAPGAAASTASCPGGVNASTSTNVAVATAIQNLMALYPYPNYVATAGNGVGRAVVEDPNIGKENYALGRIDYTLSDKDSIFARYMLDYADRDFVTNIPYWPEYDRTRDHFAAIEWHRIVSPNVVNMLHASFARTYEDAYVYGSPTVSNGVPSQGTVLTPASGQLAAAQPPNGALLSPGVHPMQFFNLTNPGSLTYATTTAGIGIPREDGSVSPGSSVTVMSASSTLPFYLVPNKFQYADDVIWTHGAHTITAGASFKRIQDNTWAPFIVAPQWTFQNLAGFVAGNATNLNGQVSDTQAPQANSVKDFRYWIFEPYINDTWKVNNRLIVNMGFRYSPTTQIKEVKQPELDLITPPFGQWTRVTTSNATNPSLRNWDPRVGLAWDVFGDHKTSVRASFGEFHSVIYSRDENYWLEPPFLTDAQTLSSQSLTGAPAPITFPTPFTNLPVNAATITSIPQNGSLSCTNCNYFGVHSTPHQIQWNFVFEREIMTNTVASVGYVGSHGIDLWAQKDFNFPLGTLGPSGRLTYGTYDPVSNSVLPNARPNPAYNYLSMADTVAYSHYNALQASLNRRFSRGFQLQVSYTYSKSIDDSSGTYGLDGGGAVYNPNNFTADRGLSNFSRTNNFRISGVYNLPYTGHGWLGAVAGGWQLNPIYTYLSGAPFSIGTISNRLTNQAAYASPRPDAVAGCKLYTGVSPEQAASGQPWFNASCFTPAPVGTFGNAGRDTIIGPNLWDMDFALQKNWRITESFRVQFKAEAFNLLNHPSFQAPIATAFNPALSSAVLANPLAGTVSNLSAGVITATNSSPRQVQLALKLVF